MSVRSRPHNGFTLVEVLVSLMIFGLISAIAYTGLTSVIKTRKGTDERLQQVEMLQRAFLFFSRDFEQVLNRPVRDEFGKSQPAFRAQQVGDFRVELTRAGWRNPAERKRSTLQRVAYKVDENKLVRVYWPVLDLAENTEPLEMVLLDGVVEFKIQFLDDKLTKHDIWPPKGQKQQSQSRESPQSTRDERLDKKKANAGASLPKAVEIILEMQGLGQIRRIFALPEGA